MSVILLNINGIIKSITGWSKYLGLNKNSLGNYYRENGKDKTEERIKSYLNGITPSNLNTVKKYNIGNIINDYEILDAFYDDYNKRNFKVKCLKCGFIYDKVSSSFLQLKNKCPNHQKVNNRKHTISPIEYKLKEVLRTIIIRCNSEKRHYKYYKAKRIEVCEEWLNKPEEFINWSLENGYQRGLTIDRINPDDGYYPENCRWISLSDNAKRVHEKTFLTVNGITDSYRGWSKRLNGCEDLVKNWIKKLGRENAIKRIEDTLKGKYIIKSYPPENIIVRGISNNLKGWSLYFGKESAYFSTIKRKYGINKVISIIENLLDLYKSK